MLFLQTLSAIQCLESRQNTPTNNDMYTYHCTLPTFRNNWCKFLLNPQIITITGNEKLTKLQLKLSYVTGNKCFMIVSKCHTIFPLKNEDPPVTIPCNSLLTLLY